jgi:hypothetical protein
MRHCDRRLKRPRPNALDNDMAPGIATIGDFDILKPLIFPSYT